MPAAKIHSPCQMITTAKAIAGIATRIRGIRSEEPCLRGSRRVDRVEAISGLRTGARARRRSSSACSKSAREKSGHSTSVKCSSL